MRNAFAVSMLDLKKPERRELLRLAERNFPLMFKAFFGKKYLLPNYRNADYQNLEIEHYFSFDRCLQFKMNQLNNDDVSLVAVANNFAALNYGKPTLFLERELAEVLLRTALLSDLQTDDIRWRWPAFKVVIPLNLISVEREGQIHSLTHFDICRVGPEQGIRCPKEIAAEIDRFLTIKDPAAALLPSVINFDFRHKESGISVATALDKPDDKRLSQTIYAVTKPWGQLRVSDYLAVSGDLRCPLRQDDKDKALLNRLEHLVLNVLLFLSATPLEYQPEQVIRHPRLNGKHNVPGLVAARFVGQVAIRPIRQTEGLKSSVPTGRHTAAHWVSGYWKRQPHGTGRQLRKLLWIMPYQTT